MINLSAKTVSECNLSLHAVLHAYALYNPRPGEVCVNTLMEVCHQELNKNIEYFEADDTDDLGSVFGVYVAKNDDTYAICIKSDLNNCWQRMVVAKELFHVIFDNPEYKTTDLHEHVATTTSDAPSLFESSPVAVQLEFLTEYAAMEFLFPYAKRVAIIESNPQPNFDAIAQQYKVPRDYVERYLSKDHMELCGEIIDI